MSPATRKSLGLGAVVCILLALQQGYFALTERNSGLSLSEFTITDYLTDELRGRKLPVGLKQAAFALPGRMTFQELTFLLPTKPLPTTLVIDSFRLKLRTLSLFRLLVDTVGEGELYRGRIATLFRRPVFAGANTLGEGTVTLEKLALAAHPVLALFGVSGELSGKLTGEEGSYTAEIELTEGAISGGAKVFGLIALPAVSDGVLRGSATVKNGRISLPELSFSSSLGTLRANCSGKVSNQVETLLCSGTVNLTKDGEISVGGYLALASGGAGKGPRWNLNLEVQQGRVRTFRAVSLE